MQSIFKKELSFYLDELKQFYIKMAVGLNNKSILNLWFITIVNFNIFQ